MIGYEYKVVPAPSKGLKAKGVKTAEARFAHALEQCMNELAADGWEYQRTDILPSEERHGLTSSRTVYRSVLVFRRAVESVEMEVIEDASPRVENSVDEETAEKDEPEESASEEEASPSEVDGTGKAD